MSTVSNWKAYTSKVDNSSALGEGRFATGMMTMIAAGPPRLAAIGGSAAVAAGAENPGGSQFAIPIGLVQNFNLSHNKNFARFWELGSDRSYFIAGRTVAQAGFGRVLYHGPSLLRMMYAFYSDLLPNTLVPSFGIDPSVTANIKNHHLVRIPPGFENIYMNLASDLFSQPCGILVYMRDSNEVTLGAMYLEETYIPSHSVATDAQGVVVQEQVSLQPERVVPVAVSAVALIETPVVNE